MDPNVALKRLRELATAPVWKVNPEEFAEIYGEMCEVFTGLDEWLSDGGFKPQEWNE